MLAFFINSFVFIVTVQVLFIVRIYIGIGLDK